MRIWRISSFADLSGLGGILSAGRWNLRDTPMVYCADHPSTALLEILVHVDVEDLPPTYQLLEIDVPDAVSVFRPALSHNWKDDVANTQRLGTDFISAGTNTIMEVPCVIVPFAKNYLLNPALLEQDGIRIIGVTQHPIDARLLG
jgi:RES domain-containing protein